MADDINKYPTPTAYKDVDKKYLGLKKILRAMTNNALYRKIRASKINPYHTSLEEIEANSLQEAKKIAREQDLGYALYKGTRFSTELNCSVAEEFEQYGNVIRGGFDVTNRIPLNNEGKMDLFSEEPIIVAVIPVEGPSLTGHAAMQYKDKVVNRRDSFMDKNPLFETYGKLADYYFIYPSQFGINPKELEKVIDNTNIEKGGKYNLFTNNCAGAVSHVFEHFGIQMDFLGPDKLGMSIPLPGNNPFGLGVENWCKEHGIHARPKEMLALYNQHRKTNMKTILSMNDITR